MVLQEDPAPVYALASLFDVSRPAVSRRLAVLHSAGLVHETRSGRENHYGLEPKGLGEAHARRSAFWRPRLRKLKKLAEKRDEHRSDVAAHC